ncbi:MAG: aminopeptidase P family protein [Helicobacteraceae bacterium]|jgi:Xaa-Pro aminopeptidase|nr:aminopeptidase P family protein [Helicobacteraceae bacterium]
MSKIPFIVKSESAQFYETGFSCDNAIALIFDGQKHFITDGRYTIEARENVKSGVEVIESEDLIADARKALRLSKEKRCAIDPVEWNVKDYVNLRNKLADFTFRERAGFHQKLRAVKSEKEIALITGAAKDNKEAFAAFAKFLTERGEGMSERELSFESKRFLSDAGKRDLSFDPIFALDSNAAKPHALPSGDRLRVTSTILFDAGTKCDRYCSDRTRTAIFDKSGVHFEIAQKFDDPNKQKIYDLVLRAHDAAIAAAKIGMKAKELDFVARKTITGAGYGETFNHSLGHGVGLDIHEQPFINKRGDTVLEEGMVFTIEPGIYIAGEFGVRIEDIVVLEKDGARVL